MILKTSTKEGRKKHLKFLKWFCLIPLISLGLGIILLFFENEIFSLILLGGGYLVIRIFLFWFFIENIIIMWKTKHFFYFGFSLIIGLPVWIFYFNYYYPYLKGEVTFNEIINSKLKFNKKT